MIKVPLHLHQLCPQDEPRSAVDTKIFLLKGHNGCLRGSPHVKDTLIFRQDQMYVLPMDPHLFHQKLHHKGFKDMKIYRLKMQAAYGQEMSHIRTLEQMDDHTTPKKVWCLVHPLDDSRLRLDDLRRFQLILYRIPWRKEPTDRNRGEGW